VPAQGLPTYLTSGSDGGGRSPNSSSWMLTGLGMAHVKLRITDIDPALFTSWLCWLRDLLVIWCLLRVTAVPVSSRTTSATTANPVGTPVGRHVWLILRSEATVELAG
jgi:hypothetical protein